MKYLILWLLLIPQQRYEVELVSCEQTVIVRVEEMDVEIQPFNVVVYDQSKMCDLLRSAQQIQIETQTNIRQEDVLSVWIFIDGELLQEQLILMKEANIIRNHPDYRYQAQLQQALKTQTVMSDVPLHVAIQSDQQRGIWIVGFLLISSLLSILFYRLLK